MNSKVQSQLPSPQLQWIQRTSKSASQQATLQEVQSYSVLTDPKNPEVFITHTETKCQNEYRATCFLDWTGTWNTQLQAVERESVETLPLETVNTHLEKVLSNPD